MNITRLSRKIIQGMPYAVKELRSEVSKRTPCFIAKPRVVHLWRNGPCDGGCIMCDLGFTHGKERLERFKSPVKDEMIPGLIDQIGQLGGRGTMVSYMCGEPLLNKSILDWVERATRLGLSFRFTTNGYHVDQATARKLVSSGLFNLGVSIESVDPKINEQIRPYPNGTSKIVNAIELLLEEKKRQHSSLSLNLKCTLTDLNLESVLDIVKRWGLIDGVIVTPQMFEVMDTMPQEIRNKLWIKDVRRIERVVRELKALKAQGYHINADEQALDDFVNLYQKDPNHCSTMHNRKVVDPKRPDCFIGNDTLFITNGPVHLCPQFPAIGSVLDERTTLQEMWTSDQAQKLRQQLRKCRTVCTLSCMRQTSLAHKIRLFLKM